MNRAAALEKIRDRSQGWDVLVIGGGATGLGVAVDAATRGYRTVLLEQHDFAKATSSRSTKLIHGGFRYLKQGNLSLVRESLRERGLLLRNAPHLVHPLEFVVPAYRWWEKPYYGAGLKLYDALAGRIGLGRSTMLSRAETLRALPTLRAEGLCGGVHYFDGQFDDARLAICLAQTATEAGAAVLNYTRVLRLLKAQGRLVGAVARDEETGSEFEVRARVVVNATGIFTDGVRRMDEPQSPKMLTLSRGAHVVLDAAFLPGRTAIMVPRTDDGRILFIIPWHGRVLVGTTDVPVTEPDVEPGPMEQEIDFLLDHAARYLAKAPTRSDILSTFAGLRPLVTGGSSRTSKISREQALLVSESGLVTITGGKWTTYRQMAEDTVRTGMQTGGLEPRPCGTRELKLRGPDTTALDELAKTRPEWSARLHPRLPGRAVEVVWAARHEMARTVEDVLARRTRSLLLDARASSEAAPVVAALLAQELGRDAKWQEEQVRQFRQLAQSYLPCVAG